jgi:sporulation related domain
MHFTPVRFLRTSISAALVSVVALSSFSIYGANDEKIDNVVEKIEQESNGNISIEIPPAILELILQKSAPKPSMQEIRPGINKLSGFRIQVFSDGRNQNTLEARAKARGSAILAKFPKYRGQVYTYSSSPNWYTRVGNFRTNAEANSALAELKRAFPNYASEMRVVKCQIVVIKQ